jgi:hypothetical protein
MFLSERNYVYCLSAPMSVELHDLVIYVLSSMLFTKYYQNDKIKDN